MDAVASLGNVGAVTSQATSRIAYQARVHEEAESLSQAIGAAALTLIRAAVVDTSQIGRHDLDLLA